MKNMEEERLEVGSSFSSFSDVESAIKDYETATFNKLFITSSRKIKSTIRKVPLRFPNPDLIYTELEYACYRRGKRNNRDENVSRKISPDCYYNGCPMGIKFLLNKEKTCLVVKNFIKQHNHEICKELYYLLNHCNKGLNNNEMQVQQGVQDDSRKIITIQNLSNIMKNIDPQQEHDLLVEVELLKGKYNADVEILRDAGCLLGLFFQTKRMKKCMESFPEFLAFDAAHKLFNVNIPIYIILVEDSNCESEVVGITILFNEERSSFEQMIDIFMRHNPSVLFTKSIITVKDVTLWDALRLKMPDIKLFLCVFHILAIFEKEIDCDKMGISAIEKMNCLTLLQKLVSSNSNEMFEANLMIFKKLAPESVFNYYMKNWHNIKDDWHLSKEYHMQNFLTSLNRNLKSLSMTLRSIVKSKITFSEFLEQLFVSLSVLEKEKYCFNAKEIARNSSVAFVKGTPEFKYATLLTKSAAEHVLHQLELAEKFCSNVNENQHYKSVPVMQYSTTADSCSCNFRKTMLLPCQHIFSLRKQINLPVFDESLCADRWRIYFYSMIHNEMLQSSILPICYDFEQKLEAGIVSDKRQDVIKIALKLVESMCSVGEETFQNRIKLLGTIKTFWEQGVEVEVSASPRLHSYAGEQKQGLKTSSLQSLTNNNIYVKDESAEMLDNICEVRLKGTETEDISAICSTSNGTTKLDSHKHEIIHQNTHYNSNTSDKTASVVISNVYSNKESTFKEQQRHDELKNLCCVICEKNFLSESGLTTHYYSVHFHSNSLKCFKCKKTFKDMPNLLSHQNFHSDETTYKSTICDKIIKPSTSLKGHKKSSSGKQLHCFLCHKRFRKNKSLKRHYFDHAVEDGCICTACTKTFCELDELITHYFSHQSHKTPYKSVLCDKKCKGGKKSCTMKLLHCFLCCKKFRKMESLKGHFFNHAVDDGCICTACSESFGELDELIQHYFSHQSDLKGKCQAKGSSISEYN